MMSQLYFRYMNPNGLALPQGSPLITGVISNYDGQRISSISFKGQHLDRLLPPQLQDAPEPVLPVALSINDGAPQLQWLPIKSLSKGGTDPVTVSLGSLPRRITIQGVRVVLPPKFGEANWSPGAFVQAPGLPVAVELDDATCRGAWQRWDGKKWVTYQDPKSGYATLPPTKKLVRWPPGMGQTPRCPDGSVPQMRLRCPNKIVEAGVPEQAPFEPYPTPVDSSLVDTYGLCPPTRTRGALARGSTAPRARRNPVMYDDLASLREAKEIIKHELRGQPWYREVGIGATEDGEHHVVTVRVAPGARAEAEPWVQMFNEELPVFVEMVEIQGYEPRTRALRERLLR